MSKSLVILVCGGRDYNNKAQVYGTLDQIRQQAAARNLTIEIIHGGAPGADSLAESWAAARNINSTCFPADWKKHHKAAGPIRNQQMIDQGKPYMVVAFNGGRGTADMIKRATANGLKILQIG